MSTIAATFQYLVGSTWTTEANYILLNLTDNLHFPMVLEITIGNTEGETLNARESVYTPYQQVRLIEGNTNRIIFYGKIEKITPEYDGLYGQTLRLTAKDNLNELLKKSMNEDVTYGAVKRSAVIEDIINGGTGTEFTAQAWPSNIGTTDTNKFVASEITPASTALNKNLKGSNKPPLRLIEELALVDPRNTPDNALFGHDFYLDHEFNALASSATGTPIPDFHYFSRGTVPNTPETNGLTLQYKGTVSNQVVPIFVAYSFPREAVEIITKVRMEYVEDKEEKNSPATKELILIKHGVPSASFTGETSISWGGNTATIEKVMADDRGLVISAANSNTTWLNTINSTVITSSPGSKTATVNSNGSIREVIGQDIEAVITDFETENVLDVVERASALLNYGGDIVIRGEVSVLKWPTHKITGTNSGTSATVLTDTSASFINNGIQIGDEVTNTTDTITGLITAVTATTLTVSAGGMSWTAGDGYEVYVFARTGHTVWIKDFPPADIADQNAIITRINYNEGPGNQTSTIELLLHATGRGATLPTNSLTNIANSTTDNAFQNAGARGKLNAAELPASYTGTLNADSISQVSWTTGNLILADGTQYLNISAGNTGVMVGREYIYWNKANPTIFTSTSNFADADGINKILIAIAKKSTTGSEAAWIAYVRIASPIKVDGADLAAGSVSGSLAIAPDTLSNALLRKGARSYITNLDIRGNGAFNTIIWDNGIALTDATITYGDTSTNTISAGNTSLGVDTHYVYINSSAADPVPLQFAASASYATAISDDNVLLAMIVVSATSDGDAPLILPFNSKKPTFSAQAIAANAITADVIQSNAVISDKIAANAVIADKIATNAIIAGKIAVDAVTTDRIVAGAITTDRMAVGAVATDRLAANAVTTAKLAANAVTANKLEATLILSTSIIAGTAGSTRIELNSTGLKSYTATTLRYEVLTGGITRYYGALAGAAFWNASSADRAQLVLGGTSSFDINILTTGYDLVLKNIGVGDDIIFDVTSTGSVRPAGTSTNLGTSFNYWNTIFGTGLRVQDIDARSGTTIAINTNPIMNTTYLGFKEKGSAPTGVTDQALVYATVDGGGKTQLRVIFQTGVSQLIAAEV